MRAATITPLIQAAAVSAIRIIQSNDDGWAEANLRVFNDALIAAGHDVLLSGPAETIFQGASQDEDPVDRAEACGYDSCPANSGAFGSNATRPDLNWVNSYPVTSIRYGFDVFASDYWDGEAPELALSGPNVGWNVCIAAQYSGTVGVAAFAAHNRSVPAIAFSGASYSQAPWSEYPPPAASVVYAELALTLTEHIVAQGAPYLPEDTFLNVNFPEAEGDCADAANYEWVLTRIKPGVASAPDAEWCGSRDLPNEIDIAEMPGCYISVSVADASDKATINDSRQKVVLDKLRDLLSCLP